MYDCYAPPILTADSMVGSRQGQGQELHTSYSQLLEHDPSSLVFDFGVPVISI